MPTSTPSTGWSVPSRTSREPAPLNSGNDSAVVVRRLWEEIRARRWDEARRCLADNLLIYWPHTGELIKGSAIYIALNQQYPEGWSIEVQSVLGDGNRASIEVRVPHQTLGIFFVTGFYEVRNGLVRKGTEYWVTEKAEVPPAWRAGLTASGG